MSTVIFWDVLHGHATTVIAPNRRVFVVDLGQGSYGSGITFSPLVYLFKNGIRRIDHLIISHPHLDHIDDILNVKHFEVRAMTKPLYLTRSDIMDGVRDVDRPKYDYYWWLHQKYVEQIDPRDDATQAANFGGLRVQSFAPRTCARSNINNHSIVTVFEESAVKVVVPGDNEACSFAKLLKSPDFCQAVAKADVLLAPHHGRKAGTYTEFLKLVNPKLCVISDGRATETNAVSVYSRFARGAHVKRCSGGICVRRC
ncbi:MAG: MBL fold metallo-hydrolase, partial [Rhodothermaceae bacterium]|nr:MBL fold metallo-hydrolase [Rhodothermaceae bacterium]